MVSPTGTAMLWLGMEERSETTHDTGNYLVTQWTLWKLEELERLRSEIPPATPWLPILVIHIRSQIKTTQSQSYKFKKNCQNFQFWNFARNFAHDTPSEIAW